MKFLQFLSILLIFVGIWKNRKFELPTNTIDSFLDTMNCSFAV
jgi:hypothetical protein